MALPLVDECDYYTTANEGRFTGHVEQFPDLRTRPCRSRTDAIAEIVTVTANHLRRLHAAQSQGR